MEASGYLTQGSPRPGGLTRLATDTGLSVSIVSRALGGQSIPKPKAVLRLAEVLGSNPAEALRAAAYDDLADFVEESGSAGTQDAPDPITARIEQSVGLDPKQRAWIAGFYERRTRQMSQALAAEVDDLIRFMGGETS